jgi:integrase
LPRHRLRRRCLHLPQGLSPQEVARLIDAAEIPVHRILLMTLYATGARRAEVARLKIDDRGSERMVIHIQGGKGRKDRDVMLRPALLDALRVYGRGLGRRPTSLPAGFFRQQTPHGESTRNHQGALDGLSASRRTCWPGAPVHPCAIAAALRRNAWA